MTPAFETGWSALPLVTVAVHAGHDVRPEVASRLAVDDPRGDAKRTRAPSELFEPVASRSSCTGRGSRST